MNENEYLWTSTSVLLTMACVIAAIIGDVELALLFSMLSTAALHLRWMLADPDPEYKKKMDQSLEEWRQRGGS